ncbi:MAG: hypothetical protein V7641_3453 [Blastocatellia bacterium]
MRHLTSLLMIIIALLAPARLFAQTEGARQAGKPAQMKKAALANQSVQSDNQITRADNPHFRFVSNQRWGQHLRIRLNNKQEINGELREKQGDHFVLLRKGKPVIIAYADIASVKTGRPFWQQVGVVTMIPLKGAMYAVIIPVGLCVLGINVLIAKIRGRELEK